MRKRFNKMKSNTNNKELSWAGMHGYVMVAVRKHMKAPTNADPNDIMLRVFDDLGDYPVAPENIKDMPSRERLWCLMPYLEKHGLRVPNKLRNAKYLADESIV